MIERLYLEYARAMAAAQLFEAALQVIAAMESEFPDGALTAEQRLEWSERFFSRPIHWIQQRLALSSELASEINDLRHARNRLAHGYLIPYTWPDDDEVSLSGEQAWEHGLPEHIQRELQHLGDAMVRDHDRKQAAAIADLIALRRRFGECNRVLIDRFMSHFPYASSWEAIEQMMRDD